MQKTTRTLLIVLLVIGLGVGAVVTLSNPGIEQLTPTEQAQTVEAEVQKRIEATARAREAENTTATSQAQTLQANRTLTAMAYDQDMLTATAHAQATAIEEAIQRSIQDVLMATLSADPIVQTAQMPVARNADWTPVEREINGTRMVLVPAGCFMMGSTDEQLPIELFGEWAMGEQPPHEQCFDEPFWIGKTEVTNAEYAEFIAAGGYDNPAYWTEAGWGERQSNNWTEPLYWDASNFNGPDQPVVGVSWYEAMAYATWRGMALPTERQWEYAARGPDGLIYPWGDEFVGANLVHSTNSGGRPAVVGSRPAGASWVGALDMAGNAGNWTLSEWRDYPYHADDGRENISSDARRVLRGGTWGADILRSRAVNRLDVDVNPAFREYGFGFGFRLLRLPHLP